MKKYLTLLLIISLSFSFSFVFATGTEGFLDISSKDWFYKEAMEMQKLGYIGGSDGYLKPKDTLTKEQTLKILGDIIENNYGEIAHINTYYLLDDKNTSAWFFKYSDYLKYFTKDSDINPSLLGTQKKIKGRENITRLEMAYLISDFLNYNNVPLVRYSEATETRRKILKQKNNYVFSDISLESNKRINKVYETGIMLGHNKDNSFSLRPNDTLSKAEGIVICYRLYEILKDTRYGDALTLNSKIGTKLDFKTDILNYGKVVVNTRKEKDVKELIQNTIYMDKYSNYHQLWESKNTISSSTGGNMLVVPFKTGDSKLEKIKGEMKLKYAAFTSKSGKKIEPIPTQVGTTLGINSGKTSNTTTNNSNGSTSQGDTNQLNGGLNINWNLNYENRDSVGCYYVVMLQNLTTGETTSEFLNMKETDNFNIVSSTFKENNVFNIPLELQPNTNYLIKLVLYGTMENWGYGSKGLRAETILYDIEIEVKK